MNAGAIQADEYAQVDGSPGRATSEAIGTPTIIFLFEQRCQHPLVLFGLRLRDRGFAVAAHS